jgi:pre-mRNA-splicing factor CWC22
MWETLRKSLNGIVNKVNVSNISNITMELFNENLMRGRGLLVKSIMKAQQASPTFTHVFAALIAALNTKLPDLGRLLIHRVISQF